MSLNTQSQPRSSFCCEITKEWPRQPQGLFAGGTWGPGTGTHTHHHERGVDVSAALISVAVVLRRLVRVLLALLAEVQLVLQLHSVEVVCTE